MSYLNEYASWTDTVAQYPETAEAFYLALGMVDEWGEAWAAVGKENFISEVGDVLWYATRYCVRVLKMPLSEMIKMAEAREPFPSMMVVFLGDIAGVEKKRIRDGANWSDEVKQTKYNKAVNALSGILSILMFHLEQRGYTLEQCLSGNRMKLSGRLEHGTIKGDGDSR